MSVLFQKPTDAIAGTNVENQLAMPQRPSTLRFTLVFCMHDLIARATTAPCHAQLWAAESITMNGLQETIKM